MKCGKNHKAHLIFTGKKGSIYFGTNTKQRKGVIPVVPEWGFSPGRGFVKNHEAGFNSEYEKLFSKTCCPFKLLQTLALHHNQVFQRQKIKRLGGK